MTKNKITLITCILLGLALIATAVLLILKKPASDGGKNFEDEPVATPTPTEIVHPDAKTIRLTLPAIAPIDEWNRRKFNEALYQDGHKYRLEISYSAYDGYEDSVAAKLAKGQTDIASMVFCDNIYGETGTDMISNGCLLELDDILSGEKGKALYDAFPKNHWESGRYNGKLYSIPMVVYPYDGVIVVFNRDYISAEAIEQWDGTLAGIYEIIKGVEWNDKEAARLQYQVNRWDGFGPLIGCDMYGGLVFDYDTMTIENPLESEKYLSYLKVMDQMRNDKYIEEYTAYLGDPNFDNNKYRERVTKKLEESRYLVAIDYAPGGEMYMKDNLVVKEIPSKLLTRLYGSVGISKKTKDVDAVVDFLSLLYTDGKYANILLYGEEGVDYKVVDDVVVKTDGSLADPMAVTFLNLRNFAYPCEKERWESDRRKALFDHYENIERSPFFGFLPDMSELNNLERILQHFWEEASYPQDDASKKIPLEDRIAKCREEMKQMTEEEKAAGADVDRAADHLENVRRQWEEYRK